MVDLVVERVWRHSRARAVPAVELQPGCQFLLGNTNPNGYAGPVDAGVFWGITDDGGIALSRPDGLVADMVGMSGGSTYKEGGTLTPLTTDVDRSYTRGGGDTNNNATDFALISPSTPSGWASSCGTP